MFDPSVSLSHPAIGSATLFWQEAKLSLEHSTQVSADAVHVILGVICMFLVALVARRPVSHWLPWAVVLLLALCNEVADLWVERWPHPGEQYGESAKDLVITMFLPTLLLLTARSAPSFFGGHSSARASRKVGGR